MNLQWNFLGFPQEFRLVEEQKKMRETTKADESERARERRKHRKTTRSKTSLSAFKAESKAIHFHFSTLTPSFKSVSFGYYRRVRVHVAEEK